MSIPEGLKYGILSLPGGWCKWLMSALYLMSHITWTLDVFTNNTRYPMVINLVKTMCVQPSCDGHRCHNNPSAVINVGSTGWSVYWMHLHNYTCSGVYHLGLDFCQMFCDNNCNTRVIDKMMDWLIDWLSDLSVDWWQNDS